MGKAAQKKREQREAPLLPARFDFGPHFLARSTAQWIAPEPGTTGIFELHEFGETRERPCPKCGATAVYRYGNWICPPADPDEDEISRCGWTTARRLPEGKATLEKCPDCGGTIVYNGNYFCQWFGDDCDWALPSPPRREADRDLALRLTGSAS
jgi:predicted RNA-binding Zn-ribbon protein involved in translation (DUF1610 family)